MKNNSEISDSEINQLLRRRLLEQSDQDLLEAEAKWVFAAEPLVIPSIQKEAELIKKLKSIKTRKNYFKWVFAVVGIVITTVIFLQYNQHTSLVNPPVQAIVKKAPVLIPEDHRSLQPAPVEIKVKENSLEHNIEHITADYYEGQFIENIRKENADCTDPILVKDTVIFSPHTPVGAGNELEISNNAPEDEQYFENEHNTVWYKFWAKEDCFLTFDIIPLDKNDDYDFMFFRYNGGDFRAKVLTKKLRPLRTCISRNDKSIQSKTGLSMNEPSKLFVHSGVGPSYVKYVEVKKNNAYYLLVDNVYANGSGHTIRFHYHCYNPGELYVGKSISLDKVSFVSDDYKFRPGSDEGLDSLYYFLQTNPILKVEIQGHVNTGSSTAPGALGYSTEELSILRAKAVYDYLIRKGIPAERLTYVGYGDRRKKVQFPTCKKEYFMNIRADILILSLDYKKDLDWLKDHEMQVNAPH